MKRVRPSGITKRVVCIGIVALVGCGTGAQPQRPATGRTVKPAATLTEAPVAELDGGAADGATATAIVDTTSTPPATATATPTPNPTPTAVPAAWPASVGLADRTACSYRCMNNAQAVDSGDLERHLSKQLGAIRQCARSSSENRVVQSDATFGPDGKLTFTIETGSVRRPMQDCMARIPSPSFFKGPLNTHWKCADYCQ